MIRFLIFLLIAAFAWSEPAAIYLTLDEAVTVCWLVPKGETAHGIRFHKASEEWKHQGFSSISLLSSVPYTLYTAALKDLEPDQTYEFVLDQETYRFKTLPKTLSRPVKFVTGGDVYHDGLEPLAKMNRIAALQNPDFVLLGGDISYAGSRFSFFDGDDSRWIDFLKTWFKTMRKEDGSLIPLVTAIGNHDVNGRYNQPMEKAALYYNLFPLGGYRVLDFGFYLSFWILDTGHTNPIDGKQTEWLNASLKERPAVLYKFALYHVPAYPSVRDMFNKHSTNVRKFWVPLFEKYGLDVAFENHEHAYKRTYRIKEGKKNPSGVLYLGDGAWGMDEPREPKKAWYLAKTAGEAHIHVVTLSEEGAVHEAISREGKLIDSGKL